MRTKTLKQKIIAVIPAREGSKGFPGKNLAILEGLPLFEHSVKTAVDMEEINEVIVTSDCSAIIQHALSLNVTVRNRPKELSKDLSRDTEFIIDLFHQDIISGEDVIVLLRPTHPVRKNEVIRDAIRLFQESNGFSSLRSMKKSKENVFKSWVLADDGSAISAFRPNLVNVDDPPNAPRQLLPDVYFQDGYVDIFPTSTVLEYNSTSGPRVLPFIINEFSHDIDSEEDLKIIETYMKSTGQINEE